MAIPSAMADSTPLDVSGPMMANPAQPDSAHLLAAYHARVSHADIKRWSITVAVLASIGGLLAAVVLCWIWVGKLDIEGDVGDELFRWGILVCTVPCIPALWRYYALYWGEAWSRKHASSLSGHLSKHSTLLHSPCRIKSMLLAETALLLIQPLPFLKLSEVMVCDLCMLMSMRLWFVARALRDTNPEHVAAVQQRKVLGPLVAHHSIPWPFALRATFARKPWIVLAYIVSIGYVLAAIFIWVAERDGQSEDFDLFNSFWFIGVTMTTVGYGDRWPQTELGKFIALGVCVFGINCTALLVTTSTKTFTINQREAYLIASIEMSQAHRAERDAAASFIQYCWRLRGRGMLPLGGAREALQGNVIRKLVQHGNAVRVSVRSSTLLGNLRRCRHERKRLCEDLRSADFQRDTTQTLQELARGQQDIIARLGQLETAISRLAGLQNNA